MNYASHDALVLRAHYMHQIINHEAPLLTMLAHIKGVLTSIHLIDPKKTIEFLLLHVALWINTIPYISN